MLILFIALKDNTEFHEVSLANNGDERDVAQALHDAFEEATAPNSRSRTGRLPHPSIEEPNPQAEEPPPPEPSPHVDPGMSVLQDSVLGLKPNGNENCWLILSKLASACLRVKKICGETLDMLVPLLIIQ